MRDELIEIGVELAVKLKGDVGVHVRVDSKVDRARRIKIVQVDGELAGLVEFVTSEVSGAKFGGNPAHHGAILVTLCAQNRNGR